MINKIRDLLKDRRLKKIDYDDYDRIKVHNAILSEKKMMKEVFSEFYFLCLRVADKYFCNEGKELEIGSGVSFFKKVNPDLITSDIIPAPHLDMVLDAQQMTAISDSSLRSVYAINVLHHFSEPEKFFLELLRVLRPGGGCILIEPFYGVFAKKFYSNVHPSEHFNPQQKEWTSSRKMGSMSNANQALSYIIFQRDKELFKKKYPNLELINNYPLKNYLRYFLSGGINFIQLAPNFFIPILKIGELLLSPFNYFLALHHVIIIRKKK